MAVLLPLMVLTYKPDAESALHGMDPDLQFRLGAAALFCVLAFFGSLLGFLLPAQHRVSVKVAAAVGILYAALSLVFFYLGALGLLGSFYMGSLIVLFSATLLAWGANALASRGAA